MYLYAFVSPYCITHCTSAYFPASLQKLSKNNNVPAAPVSPSSSFSCLFRPPLHIHLLLPYFPPVFTTPDSILPSRLLPFLSSLIHPSNISSPLPTLLNENLLTLLLFSPHRMLSFCGLCFCNSLLLLSSPLPRHASVPTL